MYVIGHGLFGASRGLQPSAMRGNVAKIVRVRGAPVMVQVRHVIPRHDPVVIQVRSEE